MIIHLAVHKTLREELNILRPQPILDEGFKYLPEAPYRITRLYNIGLCVVVNNIISRSVLYLNTRSHYLSLHDAQLQRSVDTRVVLSEDILAFRVK